MAGGRFSLEAILSLKDQMTAGLAGARTGITRYSRNFRKQMRDLTVPIRDVNRAMNRALKIGAVGSLTALGVGLGYATREFVRFDEAITQAGAKFKDLDVTSAGYHEQLKQIGKTARQVASVTEFMATDTAGALDKIAMAGLTSQQSMALLKGTTNLATAAGTDLTTAVDIATDSLGAFNLATDDAAQAQKNLTRISDVFAKTTTTANTNLTDLFEAAKKGAPAFTAAGQSLESFSALAGVLANAGVKGMEAGTNLRNVMIRLAKPTAEATKVLKSLGVQTQDAQGNFRDVVDILADFEKGLKGMGTQQRSAALATVFGARAVTGVNILLQQGTESLRKYRSELEASGGAAQKMADAMRKSLGNRLNVLKSGLLELGFRFVEAFENQGASALDKLIEAVQTFDPKPVIDFMLGVVDIGGKAFKVLKAMWPVLVGLAVAIKALAFVTGTLNVALAATPVGIILVGITLLTVAAIALAKNWDKVGAFFSRLWAGIKSAFVTAAQFIWDYFLKWTPTGMIIDNWKGILDFFVGLWDGVKEVFSSAWDWIKNIVDKITGVAGTVVSVVQGIGDFFGGSGRDARNQNTIGGSGATASYASPATSVAESRQYRESVNRSEVYVRPDRGAAISRTPGGAPEPSLSMGVQ